MFSLQWLRKLAVKTIFLQINTQSARLILNPKSTKNVVTAATSPFIWAIRSLSGTVRRADGIRFGFVFENSGVSAVFYFYEWGVIVKFADLRFIYLTVYSALQLLEYNMRVMREECRE